MSRKQSARRRSSKSTKGRDGGSQTHPAGLAHWVGKISDLPLLSHDEEIALARRIRAGDRGAFSKLVESNLRLVIRTAMRYAHPNVPLVDLVQEGNIGLLQAAERYDPDRGFRFSTYAVWWIRRAVLRALSYDSRQIRLPEHIVAWTSKLERARSGLCQELGREPDRDELAEALETTPAHVEFLDGVAYEYVSLEMELSRPGNMNVGDVVEDPRQRPERWLRRLTDAEDVDRLLSVLAPREQAILRARFGIDCGRPRTLKETGEQFDLTRERIRQIEKQALEQLRLMWASAAGEELTEAAS